MLFHNHVFEIWLMNANALTIIYGKLVCMHLNKLQFFCPHISACFYHTRENHKLFVLRTWTMPQMVQSCLLLFWIYISHKEKKSCFLHALSFFMLTDRLWSESQIFTCVCVVIWEKCVSEGLEKNVRPTLCGTTETSLKLVEEGAAF